MRVGVVEYPEGKAPVVKEEVVWIRQLSFRQLERYQQIQHDESACVELFCGKESGWADTLAIESFEAVYGKGVEINRDPFERYKKRQEERNKEIAAALAEQEKITPGITDRIVERVMKDKNVRQGDGESVRA